MANAIQPIGGERKPPPRARAWLRRVTLILSGAVAALALAEGSLQIAHVVQANAARDHLRSGEAGGRPIVAFVGDSNIYGLYVGSDETLPKALERVSRRGGATGVHTVNYAMPSAPSWVVLEQLKRAIQLKPAAAVARFGINNYSSTAPGEGLGILESSRIVKLARIIHFNWKYQNAPRFALNQGKDGAEISSAGARVAGDPNVAFMLQARDGEAVPFEVIRHEGRFDFTQIRSRLQRDIKEMADLASAQSVRLIVLGYLAGADGGFREIRELLKNMNNISGLVYCDCSKIVSNAVGLGAGSRPADWSYERMLAIRSMLLTTDRHPTPLGYELEARLLANCMKEAGVLPGHAPEDPGVLLAKQTINIPALARDPGDPLLFRVEGLPGDRNTLVFGAKGFCSINGVELPFDAASTVQQMGRAAASTMHAIAGRSGRAAIRVPKAALQYLKGDLFAACMVERGGKHGASQVLLSKIITVTFEH